MRISIIVFPGSNCDHDLEYGYRNLLGQEVSLIWHRDGDLRQPDLVILPGGFSYGDYLRTGALAKLSPAMNEVSRFAKEGGRVLGICNGFQILCEAGLLPGALLQNGSTKFLSRFVHMKVEHDQCFFTRGLSKGTIITCPIAHGEGNFFADTRTLRKLEDQGQVVFRYCGPAGEVLEESRDFNPNGSLHSIAGICNPSGNVVGLMPHPERSLEELVGAVGGQSGLSLLQASLA